MYVVYLISCLFYEMNLYILQWILRQEPGNNLCGYYVCKYNMAETKRIPEEYLRVCNTCLFFIFS